MKKTLRIALAIVALLTGVGQCAFAQTGLDFYWSNSSGGSWSVPGNWRIGSVTGTATSVAPSKDDNIFFVSQSLSNSAIITVSEASAAKNFNYNVGNKAITLQVNSTLEIAGAMSITNGNNATNKLNITTTASVSDINTGNIAIKFTSSVGTTIRSGGSNPTTYGVPVIFDGVGGTWTLQDNMTIGNRVTFVNGYVEAPFYSTNANTSRMLILNQNAAAIPFRASNDSHVIGYVQKLQLNGAMEMPVGAGIVNGIKLFRPVTATASSTNNVTAKYFNANPKADLDANIPANSGLTDISDREYWYITSNNSNGLRISLSYNRPNFPTDIESPSSEQYYFMNDPRRRNMLTVAGWRSGAGWSDRNRNDPPQINDQTRIITGTGSLSNNEFFTIASRGVAPLPVRLVSFSAQQLDGQVQLKWQSAEEKNTSHFEIEKSADGKNFSTLLTKKAQGNSAALVSYNALDNSPLNGTSYYRLKMVDLDGTFEYSKMVSVSNEGTVLVRAYPNPSNGREVQFQALNGDKLVLQTVMDAFGKAVGFEAVPVYGAGLYVNFYGSLPAGFYVATLVTDDDKRERVRVKFVVQ